MNILKRIEGWFADRYGSGKGFFCTYWHRFLYRLGKYRHLEEVDWQAVERLVFVCMGNVCRSAYAEAVARTLGLEAVSCGLQTLQNTPANAESIRTAKKRGYALEQHRTTQIMYLVLRKTDLLVAMDPWQADFLKRHLSRKHHRTLLGLWAKPVLPYISDPHGRSPVYFEKCFTYIEKAVHGIDERITETKK